jgi:REase_MTES_1575/Transcriptional regulator, AbiEi antitoxin
MSDKSKEDPLDARLAALARRQHGVVTLGQLAELGLRRSAVAERARRGRLHRVHRGVYAVGHLALTRNGRFMAAVLACGEGAALSHFSAAVLWGILDDRGQRIHVTAEKQRRCRGIVVHHAPLDGERVRRHGIVVTTPARTIVDLADVVIKPRTLERAIDEAEYLRLDWAQAAPRQGRRGSGLLSSVLAVHEPGSTRTRSQFEEDFLVFCDDGGFPRPEVNYCIEGYLCDFVWVRHRVVVETDGRQAHDTRRARERDPVRDADLQIAGWRVVRITSVRFSREPEAVAEQLRRLLTPAPAAPDAPRPR